MRRIGVIVLAVIALGLSGCGYNDMQRGDEQIKASWSEVLNQYQRRADLVPNLVRIDEIAPRRPGAQSRQFGETLCPAGKGRAARRHQCPRQGRQH